jgi:hypothetical protein
LYCEHLNHATRKTHFDNWTSARLGSRKIDFTWTGATIFFKKTVREDYLHRLRVTFNSERLDEDNVYPPVTAAEEADHEEPTDDQMIELPHDDNTPLETLPHLTDEAKTAKTLKAPYEPTEAERQLHNLTHLPYRNWCKHCVSGKSPDSAHKATDHHTTLNLVQFDYKYFTETVNGKKLQRTALTMIDSKTGIALCITVPRKGNCEYTVT